MPRATLGLDARAARRVRTAGGKGARLARLRRAGFRVPDGFVVTTDALRPTLATARTLLLESDPQLDRAAVGELQARLLALPLPPRLRRAVGRAYRRLGGPVAVRSSLVGEDAPQASFAGQLDTILDVDGEEEVLSALRRCCASLFNDRLVRYVRASGATHAAGDISYPSRRFFPERPCEPAGSQLN